MEALASSRLVAPRASRGASQRARAPAVRRLAAGAVARRAAAGPFAGVVAPLRATFALRRGRAPARSAAVAVLATAPSAEAGEEDARFKAWESSFANRHRRTDIKRIMILGAGPIVIGQARAAPPAQGSGVQLLTGRRAKPRRLPRR
jgi:hypothetical protein